MHVNFYVNKTAYFLWFIRETSQNIVGKQTVHILSWNDSRHEERMKTWLSAIFNQHSRLAALAVVRQHFMYCYFDNKHISTCAHSMTLTQCRHSYSVFYQEVWHLKVTWEKWKRSNNSVKKRKREREREREETRCVLLVLLMKVKYDYFTREKIILIESFQNMDFISSIS
jgi:hypothetical protein